MNGGQRARMTRVQELQEIEGFAAPNLPEHDSVRAVAEGSLQEIADGHSRKAILFAACFKPDEVFLRQLNLGRVFDEEISSPRRRAIFFTATIRDRSPRDTPGTCCRKPCFSMNTRSGPFTMTSLIESSRMRCSMGLRNGRIISKPFIRVSPLRVGQSTNRWDRCSEASGNKTSVASD